VSVATGDEVAMNSLVISIVEIDGGGNGSGKIKIPMFQNAEVGVTLSGIKVAEGGCIIEGKAELSGVDIALLNEQQRAKLAIAYAIFVQATDVVYNNAEVISETIDNLTDLLNKAKNFAKSYKGSKTEAARAKAYEENIKKAQNALLKSPDVPDTLKAVIATSQTNAQAAWDFYKTGQPCSVSGKSGGGEAFVKFPLADCAEYSKTIEEEIVAITNANNSFTCNCGIGNCNEITSIFNQIISGNSKKDDYISLGSGDFPLLGNGIAENSGPAFNSGIDAGKNCFQVKIEAKFKTGTTKLDLKKYIKLPAENKFILKDERGEIGVEISLLPISKGNLNDLEKYLGFVEKKKSTKGQLLTDEEFEEIAIKLGVEKCVVKAITIVEVGGKNGFLKDGITPKIRYEGHYMKRFISNDPKLKDLMEVYLSTGYDDVIYSYSERKKYTHGWDKLKKAIQINESYANQSASWGLGQIMGANYVQSGFNNISDFVEEQYSFKGQISTFINFCAGDTKLLEAMKIKDFETVARIYNGKYYKDNNYHIQMSNAYEKCK
jgi:hypothetical protein